MQVKTEMKRKVGKEPEGGSKKLKEVGNESPLSSMFQKQQTVNDLQKTRESYTAILEKGKQLGLDEAAHAEPGARHGIAEAHGRELIIEWNEPYIPYMLFATIFILPAKTS